MKEQLFTLPESSVLVALMVVVPVGNNEPDEGEIERLVGEQLSVLLTLKFTVAEDFPESVGKIIFAGQEIDCVYEISA